MCLSLSDCTGRKNSAHRRQQEKGASDHKICFLSHRPRTAASMSFYKGLLTKIGWASDNVQSQVVVTPSLWLFNLTLSQLFECIFHHNLWVSSHHSSTQEATQTSGCAVACQLHKGSHALNCWREEEHGEAMPFYGSMSNSTELEFQIF